MLEVLDLLYPWLKVAHLLFVIFWMAGLFMMPRFFVYHQESAVGSEEDSKWIEREGKLRKIILNPALMLVWALGITMVVLNQDLLSQGWLQVKFGLVLVLSGLHGYFIGIGKKIDRGEVTPSPKTMKMLNEVPVVIMIAIVLLVVLKPF